MKANYSALCVLYLVIQLCPTLCDPMDCSPPGSFVHGDSPGKNNGMGCHAILQGIFPTQELNPSLLHLLNCRQILYHRPTMESHNFIIINLGEVILKFLLNQSHQSSRVLNLFALLLMKGLSQLSLPELSLKHPPLLE